jgi:hypothetical protein
VLESYRGQWIFCEMLYVSALGGFTRVGNCEDCYLGTIYNCLHAKCDEFLEGCPTATPTIEYPDWWTTPCDPFTSGYAYPCRSDYSTDSGQFVHQQRSIVRRSSGGAIFRGCDLIGKHIAYRGSIS